MPSKKKGPRQAIGLQCKTCKSFGYVTEFNKLNEQLKKQQGDATFPLKKYCSTCRQHTVHTVMKKLK